MPIAGTSLTGRGALVTGAGAGIGAAIAKALARAGADVAIADVNEAALGRLATALAPTTTHTIVADCGDVPSVQRMVDTATERLDRLDILVANAGVTFEAGILDIDEAGWDRINRVNIKGAFFALQRAAAHMIRRGHGGRILLIGSISGRGYAAAANAAYAASKGAIVALAQYAARQLGSHNINVNAICPGLTKTELLLSVIAERAQARGVTFERLLAEMEATIPIGRANTSEDVAALAVFLASEGARNITGQSYNVDGGLVVN